MHQGNVDAERRSKHAHTRTRGVSNLREIHIPFSLEALDFGEEYDVLAVKLHAGGVYLKAVTISGQALVKGFHRKHLAALGACGTGCQRFGGRWFRVQFLGVEFC